MTETKHTPGPWDVMEGKTLLHIETENDRIHKPGISICSVPKNNKANARLIATAPELLEDHIKVCKLLGRFVILCLQKDTTVLEHFAYNIKIEYRDGEPMIKSDIIAKAERTPRCH